MNAAMVPTGGEVMIAPAGSEEWQSIGFTSTADLVLDPEPTYSGEGFPTSVTGTLTVSVSVDGADAFLRTMRRISRRVRRMPKRVRRERERQRARDAKALRDRRRAGQAGRPWTRPPFRVAGHWVWPECPQADRVWQVLVVARSGRVVMKAFTASPKPLPHLIRVALAGGHYVQVINPPGSQIQYAEYA
jgi:hypothetical protein